MMWNRAELKMRGNMAFKKNYVSAVVVAAHSHGIYKCN